LSLINVSLFQTVKLATSNISKIKAGTDIFKDFSVFYSLAKRRYMSSEETTNNMLSKQFWGHHVKFNLCLPTLMTAVNYVLQYFISLVLLTTAIGKLLDIQGFARVIESYKIFKGRIIAPIGLFISLTEFSLAIWLFSGEKLQLATLASMVLHGLFIIWLLIAMVRGLKISNCGCFGVFWARPLDWITIAEDVFMLTISTLLYILITK